MKIQTRNNTNDSYNQNKKNKPTIRLGLDLVTHEK